MFGTFESIFQSDENKIEGGGVAQAAFAVAAAALAGSSMQYGGIPPNMALNLSASAFHNPNTSYTFPKNVVNEINKITGFSGYSGEEKFGGLGGSNLNTFLTFNAPWTTSTSSKDGILISSDLTLYSPPSNWKATFKDTQGVETEVRDKSLFENYLRRLFSFNIIPKLVPYVVKDYGQNVTIYVNKENVGELKVTRSTFMYTIDQLSKLYNYAYKTVSNTLLKNAENELEKSLIVSSNSVIPYSPVPNNHQSVIAVLAVMGITGVFASRILQQMKRASRIGGPSLEEIYGFYPPPQPGEQRDIPLGPPTFLHQSPAETERELESRLAQGETTEKAVAAANTAYPVYHSTRMFKRKSPKRKSKKRSTKKRSSQRSSRSRSSQRSRKTSPSLKGVRRKIAEAKEILKVVPKNKKSGSVGRERAKKVLEARELAKKKKSPKK
jgi:hypothetical protein